MLLVSAAIHAVGRAQHVPGADEAAFTQSQAGGGPQAAQTEDNIPWILVRASLIAASNPRGSVDLDTFTLHSR